MDIIQHHFKVSSTALQRINSVFDKHIGSLREHHSSITVSNVDETVKSVVLHRLVSKWDADGTRDDVFLRNKCISDTIDYDARFIDKGPTFWLETPFDVRRVLVKAHQLLCRWERAYSISPDIEITPGETFKSSAGRVSVYEKLRRKSSYTVTRDCIDDVLTLLWETRWMRLCTLNLPIGVNTVNQVMHMHAEYDLRTDKVIDDPLYWELIWRKVMIRHILTIVDGERAETVYKSLNKDRFIGVGAFLNVIKQRQVGLSLRRISSSIGNNLERGQDDHRLLISDSTKCTIDLANASNSNFKAWVYRLHHQRVVTDLKRYRAKGFIYPSHDHRGAKVKMFHETNMLSAMGNGFTFEIMTLTLLAICRAVDPEARVYGDDIIVSNDSYQLVTDSLNHIGFNTNTDKTFVNSPLRESCGAYYMDGFGYITSFEFKRATNIIEAITLVNKVGILVRSNPTILELSLLYRDLLSAVPPELSGPEPHNIMYNDHNGKTVVFEKYVVIYGAKALFRRESSSVINAIRTSNLYLFEKLISKRAYQGSSRQNGFTVRYVPEYVKQLSTHKPLAKDNISSATAASYLYAGRVTQSYIRVRLQSRKIRFVKYVSVGGLFYRAALCR